jgi:hypothetical protein
LLIADRELEALDSMNAVLPSRVGVVVTLSTISTLNTTAPVTPLTH